LLKKKEMGFCPQRIKENGVFPPRTIRKKVAPVERIGVFPKEEMGLPPQQQEDKNRNWELPPRKRKDGHVPDGGEDECLVGTSSGNFQESLTNSPPRPVQRCTGLLIVHRHRPVIAVIVVLRPRYHLADIHPLIA